MFDQSPSSGPSSVQLCSCAMMQRHKTTVVDMEIRSNDRGWRRQCVQNVACNAHVDRMHTRILTAERPGPWSRLTCDWISMSTTVRVATKFLMVSFSSCVDSMVLQATLASSLERGAMPPPPPPPPAADEDSMSIYSSYNDSHLYAPVTELMISSSSPPATEILGTGVGQRHMSMLDTGMTLTASSCDLATEETVVSSSSTNDLESSLEVGGGGGRRGSGQLDSAAPVSSEFRGRSHMRLPPSTCVPGVRAAARARQPSPPDSPSSDSDSGKLWCAAVVSVVCRIVWCAAVFVIYHILWATAVFVIYHYHVVCCCLCHPSYPCGLWSFCCLCDLSYPLVFGLSAVSVIYHIL